MRKNILFFIFCLLTVFTTQAQLSSNLQRLSGFPALKGDSIKTGKTSLVQDTLTFNTTLSAKIQQTRRMTSVVTLRVNEQSNRKRPDSFIATVTVNVVFVKRTAGVNVTDSFTNRILTVSYNRLRKDTAKSFFSIEGAQKVTVRITNVTALYRPVDSIRRYLELENELAIERNFVMDCANDAIQTLTQDASTVATNGELTVGWPPSSVTAAAEEFDLEWTYLDSSALADGLYNTAGVLDPKLIFKNNATRVTISNGGTNSYRIPLLYDGTGSLFYRVRGSQTGGDGELKTTQWSSDFTTGLGRYNFTGHERQLNWQATTTFAEEGKRKSVVQYFDGSLRGRQTVTKDNSTNKTVVAESFYDKQGRPVIQVLPAPTLSSIIKYTPLFNRQGTVGSPIEYDKNEYDTLINPYDCCSVSANTLSNTSGASKYYSANNDSVGFGFNKFIPEANGYVFTETRYTQDNTGRVDKQGGVGKEYRVAAGLDSSHATRYYYGAPEQTELDALFGTEAGIASHYQKNMVRDANGQYSVSIVDMHGRTVATALAGVEPKTLTRLANYKQDSLVDKLLDATNNVLQGNQIEANKSIIVTKAGKHTFHYDLTPQSLQLKDCQNTTVCYDCLYDLTITMTDNCNNQQFGGVPFTVKRSNFKLYNPNGSYAIDTLCANAAPILTVDTSVVLLEGNYNITKTLSLSQSAMQYYRDSLFMKHNVCRTYEQILKEVKDTIRAKLVCVQGSSQKEYEKYREMLLQDMTPNGGQYANPDSTQDMLNIFYAQATTAGYHYPSLPYVNASGQASYLLNAAGQQVPPGDQSISVQNFANNFNANWANQLLPQHPEYPLLLQWESLQASHVYDEAFEKVETYAEAKAKGYLNPTGSNVLPASRFNGTGNFKDPIYDHPIYGGYAFPTFNGYSNEGYLFVMQPQQTVSLNPPYYLSLWGLATTLAHVPNQVLNTAAGASRMEYFNLPANVFREDSMCTSELDIAWKMFRNLYQAEKHKRLMEWIRAAAGYPLLPDPIAGSHHLNFSLGSDYQTGNPLLNWDENSTPQAGASAANNQYASTCHSYVQKWIQQMETCAYTQAELNNLMPRLEAICREGADDTHPVGSSSVKPTSTLSPFRSFDALIDYFNDSLNLIGGHLPVNKNSCNAYLLDQPKPYAQSQVLVNAQTINRPDSCVCAKLNQLYSAYTPNAALYGGSFSNYLWQKYRTSIPDSNLTALLAICSPTNTCKFLPRAIKLPPLFNCGVKDVCLPCDSIQKYYQAYITRYPTMVPSMAGSTYDTLQQQKNRLFQVYMNHQTGFNEQSSTYLNFLQQCGTATAVPNKTVCDSLQILVRNFVLPNGADCQTSFASYYNLQRNSNYIFTQIDSIYNNQCGKPLDVCNRSFCDTLKKIKADYYRTFGQVPKYDASGVDTANWKMNFGGNLYTATVPLRQVIKNGVMKMPKAYLDSVGAGRIDMDYYKYMCFPGGRWSIENRIRIPDGSITSAGIYWGSQYWMWVNTDPVRGTILSGGNTTATYPLFLCTYENASTPPKNCTLLPSGPQSFTNWATVKYRFEADSFFYYLNDVLYEARPLTKPIDSIFAFSMSFYSHDGEWDYVRIRDGNGNMLFNEEFNDCDNLSYVPQSMQCVPKCESIFADYFNAVRGSSLTNADILQLYRTNCGDTSIPSCIPKNNQLMLCGKSAPWDEDIALDGPCRDSSRLAVVSATTIYNAYRDSVKNSFAEAYTKKCMQARVLENFTMAHAVSEYHYTLYYYDQAGNLVRTVPPAGVQPQRRQGWYDSVQTARMNDVQKIPVHKLQTVYKYNSLNQLVTQLSPDAGLSKFWYDRLGRLVVSQNAKQVTATNYSYTQYDEIGRIVEVGQKRQTTLMTQTLSRSIVNLNSWLVNGVAATTNVNNPKEVTRTQYDVVNVISGTYAPFVQKGYTLRNRVSSVAFYDEVLYTNVTTPVYSGYTVMTGFSYDIHGNVDTLVHDYKQGLLVNHGVNRYKLMAYKFDLVSGKVNEVHYQPGMNDGLYHRYVYDAENRITDVFTTDRKQFVGLTQVEDREAGYAYYRHGPLARTELGHQKVQGVDYAYTLQGWLKGVNSTSATEITDIGQDGLTTGANAVTARDAFGFNLNYFTGEYAAINVGVNPFPGQSAFLPAGEQRNLYNGNITSMAVNIRQFVQPQLYNYQYDQLNRIVGMDVYRGLNETTNSWSALVATNLYKERVAYDPNGNITKYLRHGDNAANVVMDSLTYKYNVDASGDLVNNRLRQVRDTVPDARYANVDLDIQTNVDNYGYDAIGNLTSDVKEGITSVLWTVYGKIKEINKTTSAVTGTVQKISYTYDASGNRLSKTVTKVGTANDVTTWYVRDASGNIMGIYEAVSETPNAATGVVVNLVEHDLYGSSRLGVVSRNVNVDVALPSAGASVAGQVTNSSLSVLVRGLKNYELSNHLGNVLVTISDKKLGVSANGTTIDYYTADVLSATDYYVYGMGMIGRKFTANASSKYRFSVNGQEKESDLNEDITSAMYWEYDSRIGRRWNVDPVIKVFESSYLCFRGNPILFSDSKGDQAGDPQKLYHATNNALAISKNGFSAETLGKYSSYNWFTSTPSNTNPSDASAYGNTTIEIEANVSNAKVITKSQTEAWKQESLTEMGYTTNSFNKLAKSNKTLWNQVNSEVWGRVYGKVGEFMNKDGASAYFLEKDGTYALSESFANSSKVTGFSGAGAPNLLKQLESTNSGQRAGEAATKALKELDGSAKLYKWGTKTIAIIGIATAAYEIYRAENKPKEFTKQVVGLAAGSYCAGVCALSTSETGPGAIIGGTLGFAFGYFIGSESTELIWQITFERGVQAK
jgi:YD repeat-containing protein